MENVFTSKGQTFLLCANNRRFFGIALCRLSTVLFVLILCAPVLAQAQEKQAENDVNLAKKLANPIASLISAPIQFNYDGGYGSKDGEKAFANVQPVIPFKLTNEFSLVTRTILPVAWQDDVAGNSGSQFGLGDTLQSFFLVPNPVATSVGTVTYGGGPAINWPTSTDRLLGSGTLGIGPTGVVLAQKDAWTYGGLVNQIWGVAETRDSVPNLNSTFMQPFVAYTTKEAWTYTLDIESTYNWTASELSLPFNATVSKLTDIGGQKVQFQGGLRYWAVDSEASPEGFGGRVQITFLFP